jgi:glucan phosphoethanolaminetransferase (alkaline phosphatase superfamily)
MPDKQVNAGRAFAPRSLLFALRILAIFVVLAVTNPGVPERIIILAGKGNWALIVVFVFLWMLAAATLLIVVLLPKFWARGFWGLAIAASTAAGYCFYLASQTELSIFDAVSMWSARHEAGRAMSIYQSSAIYAAVVFIATFLLFVLPPPPMSERIKRWLHRLAFAPVISIAIFAYVIAAHQVNGSRALPAQFAPLSIGVLVGIKVASNTMPERNPVAWRPGTRMAKHVVLLVDESVRSDSIDFRAGNPYTPEIARLKDRLINFGPAVSGGNCSNYSNAILRFGASRHELTQTLLRNATMWRYAKQAGYRTVFIDAQAALVKGYSGKFQNFMSAEEAKDIDDFHALDVGVPLLDDKLMDIVVKDLSSDAPVFIYAVKNGAHFPYDRDYPLDNAEFRPITLERGLADTQARVNSYRNAVKWSVDRILKRLMGEADLKDTVVIYTSDHGQNLTGVGLTHCTTENPDSSEGLVPMMAITDNLALRSRFADAAEKSRGHASHFEIAPTILQLFGYAPKDVQTQYAGSLFDRYGEPAAFTSGDIFGLFSSTVRWHPVDLGVAVTDGSAVKEP